MKISKVRRSNQELGKGEILYSSHHCEGNVEGGHKEVAQCEVCYEKVGDGVKSPGPNDDTEDQEVSKQRDDDNQAVETHDQIIRHFEILLVKVDTMTMAIYDLISIHGFQFYHKKFFYHFGRSMPIKS